MPSNIQTDQDKPDFTDPLLGRFFLSPDEKQNKEKGKAIVKGFYTQQTSEKNADGSAFFNKRVARWDELLLWAKGSQSMEAFKDLLYIDGNETYSKMDWTPQRIASGFVRTLEESMSKNEIYPCVKCIDDGSMREKEQRMFDALYRMHEVETIKQLQDTTGVQVEPPGVYVPDDEMSAKVHFELQDQIPKEIRFEKKLAKVQNDISFKKVVNRKTIFDLISLNFAATKIERESPGNYLPRKCVPNKMAYNFFMNDTGELEITQIGEFYNLKVKDFRAKFGKSAGIEGGMTEKEIWQLAKESTVKNSGIFNFNWNNNWGSNGLNQNRPYDDYSILVFDCEINCGEDVYFVEKTDAYGKGNISQKQGIPGQQKTKNGTIINQALSSNTEIITRQKDVWMRGVYAPYGDKMLYWGRTDLIINEYSDTSKSRSSYTVVIPHNDGEYVPSLFEGAMEPLREHALAKLKRKQLIAALVPAGIKIDVESARNIKLGNGDVLTWQEILRIYKQTGDEVWSSLGVNPNERQTPALGSPLVDGTIQKVIELTNVLESIVGELRITFGVPTYRDGSDVGDRTSGVLQQQQNESSYNRTDFITTANNQLWEETFYKICLLHWNDEVKAEPESKSDMINTRFDVSVKMKMTEYEKQRLENDIQLYGKTVGKDGKPIISPKDAMMLREIDDFKLACWYLATTVEQNDRKQMQDADRAVQMNAKAQQDSNEQTAQNAEALEIKKAEAEKQMVEFKATKEKELALLVGYFAVAAKDESGQMMKMFLPAIQQLVPNITIPLMQENKQMQQNIVADGQQEQQQQQVPQQQEQPDQQMQMANG